MYKMKSWSLQVISAILADVFSSDKITFFDVLVLKFEYIVRF